MSAVPAEPKGYEDLPPHCPDWCIGDHLVALSEGCSMDEVNVHRGGEVGRILPAIAPPDFASYASDGNARRPGGDTWRTYLEAERAYSGWDQQTWARLEVTHRSPEGTESIDLRMTPAEMLELARSLQHTAELALFETFVRKEWR